MGSIRTQERLIAALFGVLFLAFAGLSWAKWPLLTADSARELYVPFHLRHGATIYQDFYYLYGPVAPYLNAGLLGVFGDRLEVLYLAGLVNLALILGLLFAIARQVLPPWPSAAVVFLFFTHFALGRDIWGYVWPYAFAATYGVTLGLFLVLALIRHQHTGRLGWLVGAGVAVGLSAVTKLEYGAAAIALAGIYLAGRLALGHWLVEKRPFWQEAACLMGPAVLVGGAIATAVLTRVPLPVVLESVWPTALMKVWNSAGAWHGTFATWMANFRWVVFEGAVLGGIAAHGAVIDRLKTRGPLRWVLIFAPLAALPILWLFRHTLIWHYNHAHHYWMSPGFLLLFAVLAGVVWQLARTLRAGGTLSPTVVAWGLIAAYGCLVATRTLMTGYNDYTRYQAPVALIAWVALAAVWLPNRFPRGRSATLGMMAALMFFLGGRHVVTHVGSYLGPHVPVSGPVGTVLAQPTYGEPFNQALAYVKANLRPGEAIVAAPMEASFYTFTGLDNPLRYDNLFLGYLTTSAEQAAVIRRIEEKQVRYLLISNYGGPHQFGKTFMQELNAWIVSRCRLVGDYGGDAYRIRVYETPFARP